MNEYERKQAEELAEKAYPSRPFYETGINPWPQSFRDAFIEGYEAALETVAPTEGTAEEAERLLHESLAQKQGVATNFLQEIRPAHEVYAERTRGATYKDGVQLDPNRPEPPFPGGPTLDPLPWVCDFHPYERWAYPPTSSHFEPRDGYSQERKDYMHNSRWDGDNPNV